MESCQWKKILCKIILGTFILIFGLTIFLIDSQRKENKLLSKVVHPKLIAITFDDGPHPVYTPQLLDTLKKYKVKATFFVIGSSVKRYPEIVKKIVNQGHAIGNHTYTHPYNLTKCSLSQITKEITDCQTIIRRVTGRRVFIFRPPRGCFNQLVIRMATRNKYKIILWSICGDRRDTNDPRIMAKNVVNHIKAGDIILLHDGTFDSRWKDVEAARYIIQDLQKKGFQFETIPRLLKIYKNSNPVRENFHQ